MNYSLLIQRGSAYTFQAADNWHARINQLIKLWFERGKCPRVFKLSCEMQDRLTALRKAYVQIQDRQKAQEREAQNELVYLDCPACDNCWSPHGTVTVVRLRNYEPGKLICVDCGGPLVNRDEHRIPGMLAGLGVTANDY